MMYGVYDIDALQGAGARPKVPDGWRIYRLFVKGHGICCIDLPEDMGSIERAEVMRGALAERYGDGSDIVGYIDVTEEYQPHPKEVDGSSDAIKRLADASRKSLSQLSKDIGKRQNTLTTLFRAGSKTTIDTMAAIVRVCKHTIAIVPTDEVKNLSENCIVIVPDDRED